MHMRTRRSFVALNKTSSNISLEANNTSVRTNYSAAKSWRLHRHFRDKGNGTEISPIHGKCRKRDRFKAMFTGWNMRYLVYENAASSIFDLEPDQNNTHEDRDHSNSDDSLSSVMQEARSNTLFNRMRSGRKSYSQNEAGSDLLRPDSVLRMSGSKRVSSRYIKEQILHRLAKKAQTAIDPSEDIFEIPSELTKTIASCVLDNRSFVSTENSLSGNVDLKVNLLIPEDKNQSTPINDTITEQSLEFTPRYHHAFYIEPPPRNLPKHLHAKWERSQMFKNTARTYDHEKWKSNQQLLNQENLTDDEKPKTEYSVTTKSSIKDCDNLSTNIFENASKVFTANSSSKVSTCTPSSPKGIFRTTKLFLPATPKIGNLSSMFSFKNGKTSHNSSSSRFNSMASSFQSASTISSSRSACKISTITNKNFNYAENYSLYSQDTFCHKKANKYTNNIQKQSQDETFSEFSF